jgi:hypothetical protein
MPHLRDNEGLPAVHRTTSVPLLSFDDAVRTDQE